MSADLSGLLLPGVRSAGTQLVMPATCTAWDGSTKHSTVVVGTVTYTNLAVVNAAAMATGPVVLLNTPGAPIILGPLTVPV